MLKKTITYTDFNDTEVSEDFFFHLSKADLIELEVSHDGGLAEALDRIVKSGNGAEIIKEFKNLILSSYGHRSDDGKRFVKNESIRREFQSTEAFSSLFVELCTDAAAASTFVNGIVPNGLQEDMKAIGQPKTEPETSTLPETLPDDIDAMSITLADAMAMDSDELQRKIAEGWVIQKGADPLA